jgi:phosphonoacetaldehyde hydrolase
MIKSIQTIIFDWAGTTVDYGSFAPVDAFKAAFSDFGINPTIEETRAPMGLQKRAHIEKMLEGGRLAALWKDIYGRAYTKEDVNGIYDRFEPALFAVLKKYADPIPGVIEAVARIRDMGIFIGSTTGYTQAMMDVVAPLAREKGYAPDCLVCPDETGGIGRPFPYMLWRNLEKLGAVSIGEVVKVGDTEADMQEGRNAGCICVGVLAGSSMLGLSERELAEKSESERNSLFDAAKKEYFNAGADYVIEEISCLPDLVESIVKQAKKPYNEEYV